MEQYIKSIPQSLDSTFNPSTIHYINTYTTVEKSLAVPIKDGKDLINIATQQSAKWSPNTILATSSNTPTSKQSGSMSDRVDLARVDDGEGQNDEKDENVNVPQPNLDIDSTHIIMTEHNEYDFDITTSSKLHPRNALKVQLNDEAKINENGHGDNLENGENGTSENTSENGIVEKNEKIYKPSPEEIEQFNKHPIFKLLSPHDSQYIQSISLQLASHQSTLQFPHLNGYKTTQKAPENDQNDEKSSKSHTMIEKSFQTSSYSPNRDYDLSKLAAILVKAVPNPFPATLSLFQAHGIAAVLHNHHLLVTAHTGSGKTMAAHAIILHTLALGGKVVYTAPIKALSNQKYAELSRIYPDVGLHTGDMNVNPNAQIVVMTTEILRNMSIHSDSQYTAAIFDEVHYMEDQSRGVIWEETLLTLPLSTQMIFLSASVENGDEFAKWISKVTKRPCHIVNTRVRAVPIAHLVLRPPVLSKRESDGMKVSYIVNKQDRTTFTSSLAQTASGLSIYTIPGVKMPFPYSEYGYLTDLPAPDGNAEITKDIPPSQSGLILQQIVSALLSAIKNHWLPLIAFSFDRKGLDGYARDLYELGFCVTTQNQQEEIERFCQEHFEPDTPDRENLINQLKSGIGVHHSGQIARVREVVETLLGKSLIKILFATETFAVGINVPVRSVLFTAVSKFDGIGRRIINPTEYTQMSGRAGRRGMDSVGVSIMIQDRMVTPHVYRSIVSGGTLCLESRFRVSIGLLLSSFKAGSSDKGQTVVNSITSRGKPLEFNQNAANAAGNGLIDYGSEGREQQGYTLQKVIENSFAIFRFSNNKTSIANAMLTRSLLLFVQFINKVYLASRKQPSLLERFLPWIDIEKTYRQIGPQMIAHISPINLSTFSIVSLVLDENSCLALNQNINLRKIADAIITPSLFFPLYIQSLYLITSAQHFPVSSLGHAETLAHHTKLQSLPQSSLFAFTDLYQTVFSLLDQNINDILSFKPMAEYLSSLQQKQQLQNLLENNNNNNNNNSYSSNTIDSRPIQTIYNSPLDSVERPKPQSGSTFHLLKEDGDPNDVISYCIPGRVVYIDFPTDFHSTEYNDNEPVMVELLKDRSGLSMNTVIPNTIGWGVVVGAKMQYSRAVLIDVLVALPRRKNSSGPKFELHVLSFCECAISKISSIVLHLPNNLNLNHDSGLTALWLALRQASDTWRASMEKSGSNNNFNNNNNNNNNNNTKYSVPAGLTINTNINSMLDILSNLDTQSLISFSTTQFPLIFSRTTIPVSGHNSVQHRSVCGLIELTKKKMTPQNSQNSQNSQQNGPNSQNGQNVQNVQNVDTPSSTDNSLQLDPFRFSCDYLGAVLVQTLEQYPPPIRALLGLFLDTQACWISSKIESFKHISQLASTSYNNSASTELTGAQVSVIDSDGSDDDDEEDEDMQQLKVLSADITIGEEESVHQKQLRQLESKKKSSVQSIVTKYLSTVSVMTKYMLEKEYIVPQDQSTHYISSTNHYIKALMNSTTRDITQLLSNFKTQNKGIVCSHIDNPNSIIITELIYDNQFSKLSLEEFAAVCSIFVTSKREADKSTLTLLPAPIAEMYERILSECESLELLSEKYNNINNNASGNNTTNDPNNPPNTPQNNTSQSSQQQSNSLLYDNREMGLEMVLPVLKWCQTHDIQLSLLEGPRGITIFPGNLSRVLTRLVNLFQQIQGAADAMGDSALSEKLKMVSDLVQQGSLFVSSLHILSIQEQRNRDLGRPV